MRTLEAVYLGEMLVAQVLVEVDGKPCVTLDGSLVGGTRAAVSAPGRKHRNSQ